MCTWLMHLQSGYPAARLVRLLLHAYGLVRPIPIVGSKGVRTNQKVQWANILVLGVLFARGCQCLVAYEGHTVTQPSISALAS